MEENKIINRLALIHTSLQVKCEYRVVGHRLRPNGGRGCPTGLLAHKFGSGIFQ